MKIIERRAYSITLLFVSRLPLFTCGVSLLWIDGNELIFQIDCFCVCLLVVQQLFWRHSSSRFVGFLVTQVDTSVHAAGSER